MDPVGGVSGHEATRVAFGSGVERLLFPVHSAPTRLGIEQGLRGAPHRGPGSYSPDPITLFLNPLDKVPRSTRGWYFGANRASRTKRNLQGPKPGPADYQRIRDTEFENCFKPFSVACSRWKETDTNLGTPGPGTYQQSEVQRGHVEFEESFGRGRKLKSFVMVKCTNGIPDKCDLCHQVIVGDYFQKDKTNFCCKCHNEHQKTHEKDYNRDLVKQFQKVRDCTGLHKHDFVGKDPKIMLKSEKELKKLRQREAYLRLYYSD